MTTIRPARTEDAGFLAVTDLIALRSHINWGTYDLLFDSEKLRLRFLERMVTAEPRCFIHYSHFLVGEVDETPAAALCGYTEGDQIAMDLRAAVGPVLRSLGISEAEQAAREERIAPWQTCPYDAAPGEWVIEWVGALPRYRRRGVVHALLEAVLRRGRDTGHHFANVAVLIGNDAAQRAYEKVGFVAYKDVRHPDFERAARAPGMRKLRRPL